jgi:sugar lactone lactonase YvrE
VKAAATGSTDTARGTIWQYDYDLETAEISNKRVFVRNGDWHPDGICSDAAGSVYAAIYGGSRIDVFDYRGDLQGSITLPVPNPTSCVIGGEGDCELFITSAREGMTSDHIAQAHPCQGKSSSST